MEFEKILLENLADKNQLVIALCQFLKRNHEISKKNIDLSVLMFLYKLNPSDYILGTSDQDYTSLKIHLMSRELTKKEELKESVMLIWDLISYMTDEICPSCNQANLRLYTDTNYRDVYAACEECFSCRKDGVWIISNEELYPANSYLVHRYLKNNT